MHRTHALIQKYILAGSLVLNTSDDVFDKLFYDGNLYPMHQHQHSQSISSRCSEHALRAPVLPAISTRVFNYSEQWRRDLDQCARGDYIAIVSVVNNQAHRIVEWVVHNLLLGVDFIQICDDCSVDNLREVLQPFVESNLVHIEGVDVWNRENSHQFQSQCYSWFWSQNVSSRFTYVANYDVDEFIVTTKEKCITPAIQRFERKYPNASSLLIPWTRFVAKSTASRSKCTSFEMTAFSSGELSKSSKLNTVGKPLCSTRKSTGFPQNMPHMCDPGGQNLFEDGRRTPSGKPSWNIISPTPPSSLNLTLFHFSTVTFEDFVSKAYQRHWMRRIHHGHWPTPEGIRHVLEEWEHLKPSKIYYSPHVKYLNSRLRSWLDIEYNASSCKQP